MRLNIKYDFSENSAFVFGGAGGIAGSISESIGGLGGRISLFDLNAEMLDKMEKALKNKGIWVRTYETDITDERSVSSNVASAIKEAGKVDILINAASIINRKPFFDITYREWQRTVSINLNGTYLASSIVGRRMLEDGYGRIVNFTSQNSSGALKNADYSASKAAVDSLTRSMALEFRESGKDVTINAVSPPPTLTELWKAGRTEQQIEEALKLGNVFLPEEMTHTILFLCTRESSSISGQIVSHRSNLFRVPNK